MKEYDHKEIEAKWQKEWEKKKVFNASDFSKKPKFYGLIEFPYPSGDGLHVGHIRSNTAMDVIARKRRMEGFNVLYPIGWDAFGLPTENYAIKTGISPEKVTKINTDIFRRQLKSIGFSFDWSREVNTTDPKYYKWTQWLFLQFLKHDLAYKAKININWCPKDKIGLANEEVIGGCCERCGTPVEKREKEQWMLRITKYADKLDKDLDDVDFLEKIKLQQRNWIGRSEGAEIGFKIKSSNSNVEDEIKVFTTRPDTIFGATYVVLAPENELVSNLKSKISNWEEVEKYIKDAKNKTEIERGDDKEKTGVQLKGLIAINPANNEEIPVFIADYVIATYGTGAVMAVPAHDERDFAFANKYNLPVLVVVSGGDGNSAYVGDGKMINSGKFDGQDSELVKKEITKFVGGKWVTKYKLRDWVFSRQRYWGEPIPVVHCDKCGVVPLSEKDLPLKLPKIAKYEPTNSGESPLAGISKWVNTKCPKCFGKAKRETDTMPNWAGSSWYFLRYCDPKNSKKFADIKKLKYWMQVDWYNGGMEHTTLHLLYSRFWNKFLFDIGLVPFSEAYKKRTSHGMILAKNGEKMSKSKGNVINPDDIVKTYGADTLRMYEMFMGPFDQAIAWGEDNIIGVRRFIERVWKIQNKVVSKTVFDTNMARTVLTTEEYKKFETLLHKTVKKVSDDIESMRFNTAISSMMILVNFMDKIEQIRKSDFEMFLKVLSLFAPHVTEEIWAELGNKKILSTEAWPKADPNKMKETEITIAIQINGKVRAETFITSDMSEADIIEYVKRLEDVDKWIAGKEIRKIIYVPLKLVSIVV